MPTFFSGAQYLRKETIDSAERDFYTALMPASSVEGPGYQYDARKPRGDYASSASSRRKGAIVAVDAHEPERMPAAAELVARARQRLAAELERMPSRSLVLLRAWLRASSSAKMLAPGALAHLLRIAAHGHDLALAGDIFVLLLEHIEGVSRRWAEYAVGQAGIARQEERAALREDLRQDLTLHLWEQLALRDGEQWELFFWRALDYAQRHVAMTSLRKRGYWTQPGTARPVRALARLMVSLSGYDEDERSAATVEMSDPTDAFAAADLLDLRGLILRLPLAERITIVMRYWQDASEEEIASALGGVTTRTVRNHLRRAYARLRDEYGEGEER